MLSKAKVKPLYPQNKKQLIYYCGFFIDIIKVLCYNGKNTKRSIPMAVSYNKLWKKLIDMNMTKTDLRVATDMSTTTLAKLGKNETVSMDVMLRICKVLQCNIGDIMDATEEEI